MPDDILAGDDLVVVMYHYVRDPRTGARQPHHMATDRFRRQIEALARCRVMVTPADFLASITGSQALPQRAALLTFDDGLTDHYREVRPILAEHGIKAAFYANAASVLNRMVLPVHKLQFIIANAGDPAVLLADVRTLAAERGVAVTEQGSFRLRLENQPVTEVKRLLQRDLPPADRHAIIDELFRRAVTTDERAFAEELYATAGQLAEMSADGHHIGNHGARHERYATLSADEQARDIDDGLELVRVVTGEGAPHTFCFPFGDHDDATLAALRARGCVAAFGIAPGPFRVGAEPLQVPRYDCVDLPN